jgi:hypothetical protein
MTLKWCGIISNKGYFLHVRQLARLEHILPRVHMGLFFSGGGLTLLCSSVCASVKSVCNHTSTYPHMFIVWCLRMGASLHFSRRMWLWPVLRYYLSTVYFLSFWGKPHWNSWSVGWDSKWRSPTEAGLPTCTAQCLVRVFWPVKLLSLIGCYQCMRGTHASIFRVEVSLVQEMAAFIEVNGRRNWWVKVFFHITSCFHNFAHMYADSGGCMSLRSTATLLPSYTVSQLRQLQ